MRVSIVVLMVALMLALMPVAASANYDGQKWLGSSTIFGYDEFTWKTSFGGWMEDSCNTSAEKFKATLFKDSNYGGYKVRVCDNWTAGVGFSHLCTVPVGPNSSGLNAWECLMAGWLNSGVAQDKISSIKLNSGFPEGKCLRLYIDGNHSGSSTKMGTGTNIGKNAPNFHIYSVGGTVVGDNISSIKKVSC